MKLGVLIVAFRSRNDLAELLPALQGDQLCLLVVDNASDDGTADWVRANAPWVELVANRENLGFAGAINQGMQRLADCDAVLWLNPDARIAPKDIQRLADALREDARIAAIGPAIVRDGKIEPSLLLRPVWWRTWLFLLSGMRAYGLGGITGKPAPGYPWQTRSFGDHLRGSCMLVRKEAWRDVGALDTRFFLYFEETEWCLRAREKGWRIAIEPTAKAWHRGKGSVATVEKGVPIEYIRSAVLFWEIVHPRAHRLLQATLLAVLAVKWLLARLLKKDQAASWLGKALAAARAPRRYPLRYPKARRPKAWSD